MIIEQTAQHLQRRDEGIRREQIAESARLFDIRQGPDVVLPKGPQRRVVSRDPEETV